MKTKADARNKKPQQGRSYPQTIVIHCSCEDQSGLRTMKQLDAKYQSPQG